MKALLFALMLLLTGCASAPVSTVRNYNAINKTLALDNQKLNQNGKLFLIAAEEALTKMSKSQNDLQLQAVATLLHQSQAALGVREADKIEVKTLQPVELDKKLKDAFTETRSLLLRHDTLTETQKANESILINKGIEKIAEEQNTFWKRFRVYVYSALAALGIIAFFVYVPAGATRPIFNAVGKNIGKVVGRFTNKP